MGENTKIEWCKFSFNGWIGCSKVSPGCDSCYAEKWDSRFAPSGHAVRWGVNQQRTLTSAANWKTPIKWNKEAEKLGIRYRVFTASLSDVFDNEVPAEWRNNLFSLIHQTPHLDWLILTKRIGNAEVMISNAMKALGLDWDKGWKNVWLGATIVNQEEANRDIPKLIDTPAFKRFLSMEPLLGHVDLTAIEFDSFTTMDVLSGSGISSQSFCQSWPNAFCDPIDWVIVGGETGTNARPMHPEWATSIQKQCAHANIPFFFKQWGEWQIASVENGHLDSNMETNQAHWVDINGAMHKPSSSGLSDKAYAMVKVGKKISGRLLNGILYDEFPKN